MNSDAKYVRRHSGDRIEVLDRIVQRRALQQRFVDMGKRPPKQQCVTVRFGARNRGRTEGGAPTADVLDDQYA
jgi:hypothetical protein